MKFSPLVILSIFSLAAVQAEFPNQEESSFLPVSTLHLDLASNENELLDQELFLLDAESDDLEEELNFLDASIAKSEEKAPGNPFETKDPAIQSPVINISMPFDNSEQDIALDIIEDKAAAITKDARSIETISGSTDDTLLFRPSDKLSSLEAEMPGVLTIESSTSDIKHNLDVQLDIKRAFAGSPLIYSLLFGMSVFSVFIWFYSILSLKKKANVPQQVMGTLHSSLNGNHFDQALSLCNAQDALLCKMVASGIQSRKYGLSAMIESMKAEGKRSSMGFWQKIGLLNDIAILAPMLGLLGTVLGMFYAFYDVNRSMESITSLFDGLGVSVGTTVAGLIVAILALILHSTAKYRLIKVLSQVESDAHGIASLIDNHASLYGQSK